MIFKNSFIMILIFTVLSGCASTHRIPTINDSEAFKYERKYLAESEYLKDNYADTKVVKWVQPANKKMACKVYVSVSKGNDRTLDNNYSIFWDGDCKNGYANGLGREFEKGTVLDMEAIAIYHGKQQEPQYYVQKYHLDNKIQVGDINNGYYVETTINEDNFNFDINYRYGFFGSIEKPYQLITNSSPFNDNIVYYKRYRNFSYVLYDMTNNEFDKRNYEFHMNEKGKVNGFGFTTPKVGATVSGEATNGKIVKRVILPNSYFTKIAQVGDEVKEAGQKAINAQKYALKVKKQYMSRICKEQASVNFIDNDEYKKICNESEYFANLKIKMDTKLTQINKLKQQKREQLNQQELINAQVRQANAAQRQANATERNASAAENANNMQSWQNLNENLQMQQLNNNLMFMRMGY